MDIECQFCGKDYLYFASGEFVRSKCGHLFHRDCIEYMGESCVVCKKQLRLDRLLTWRKVFTKFAKDIQQLEKILDVIKQVFLKSSDEKIRSSANRWHRARTNLVQSIIKLGGRCSRESMALMSKGVIAFEKSPEKEQINETIAEMRKLLKQLYSYVKVILKGDMTEEVKSALQTIFVNIRMT